MNHIQCFCTFLEVYIENALELDMFEMITKPFSLSTGFRAVRLSTKAYFFC